MFSLPAFLNKPRMPPFPSSLSLSLVVASRASRSCSNLSNSSNERRKKNHLLNSGQQQSFPGTVLLMISIILKMVQLYS